MNKTTINKVVLAYSGGLDTSIIARRGFAPEKVREALPVLPYGYLKK